MRKVKKLNLLLTFLGLLILGLSEANASKWDNVSTSGGQLPYDSSVFAALSSATQAGTGMLVVSGTQITLYGIHVASNAGVTGAYLTFKDTDSLTPVVTVPTVTVIGISSTSEVRIQFNPPLRFTRGLYTQTTPNVCLNAVPGWCYTVLYDVR